MVEFTKTDLTILSLLRNSFYDVYVSELPDDILLSAIDEVRVINVRHRRLGKDYHRFIMLKTILFVNALKVSINQCGKGDSQLTIADLNTTLEKAFVNSDQIYDVSRKYEASKIPAFFDQMDIPLGIVKAEIEDILSSRKSALMKSAIVGVGMKRCSDVIGSRGRFRNPKRYSKSCRKKGYL